MIESTTVLFDEADGITNGANVFRFLILDLGVEFLLHGHDDFNQVQGIRVEIADKLSVHRHFVLIHTKALRDNAANTLINRRQRTHLHQDRVHTGLKYWALRQGCGLCSMSESTTATYLARAGLYTPEGKS